MTGFKNMAGRRLTLLAASLAGALAVAAPACAVWPGPDWAVSFSRTYGGHEGVLATYVTNSSSTYTIYRNAAYELRLVKLGVSGGMVFDVALEDGGGYIKRMHVDDTGNSIVAGGIIANAGVTDFYLARYDLSGNLTAGWPQQYNWGTPDMMYSGDITQDGLGNVAICGYFVNPGSGTWDGILVKYDVNGAFMFNVTWDESGWGSAGEFFFTTVGDAAGNVYVGGVSSWPDLWGEIWVYDNTGAQLSYEYYSITDPTFGAPNDNPRTMRLQNGSLWMGLYGFHATDGVPVVAVMQEDPNWGSWGDGVPLDYCLWKISATAYAVPGGLAIDSSDNAYITGQIYNAVGSPAKYDLFVTRFDLSAGVYHDWAQIVDFGGDDAYDGNSIHAVTGAGVDGSGNVTVSALATRDPCIASKFGTQDLVVRQYNSAGVQQWESNYDRPAYHKVEDVTADGAGGIYHVVNSVLDTTLVKHDDATQVLQWERTPSFAGYCTFATGGLATGGGINYVSANLANSASGVEVVGIARFDLAGVEQAAWPLYQYGVELTYPGPLVLNGAGDPLMAGYYWDSIGSDYDLIVVQFDAAGAASWATPLDNLSSDLPQDVALDGAGDVYILQTNTDSVPNATYRVTKLSSGGALQWSNDYGAIAGFDANARGIAGDGTDIYVTGHETDGTNSYGRVIKIDTAGTVGWTLSDEGSDMWFGGITVDPVDKNIYVAGGEGNQVSSIADFASLSFGSDAAPRWATSFDSGMDEDAGRRVMMDSGAIYFAGDNTSTSWVWKYTEPPVASIEGIVHTSATIIGVGEWIYVTYTVTNVGAGSALNVTPDLEINSGSAFADYISGPVPLGPLTLPGGASTVFVWTYSGTAGGTICFTGSVTGLDSGFFNPLLLEKSDCFKVVKPATLEGAVATPSSSAYVGTSFVLTLTITNTGDVASNGIVPGLDFNSGAGLASVQSGPTPASLVLLAGGGSVTFSWTITVTGEGTLTFTASGTGTDGGTGSSTGYDSGSILLASMAVVDADIVFIYTAPLVDGDTFDVAFTITNTGTADVNAALPALEVNSGGGLVNPVSGPLPPGPVTVPPGGATTFVWTYDALTGGSVCYSASATGTDAGVGGGAIRGMDSDCQIILNRAKLEAAVSTPSSSAYVGTNFVLTMTVTNTGDLTSGAVTPDLEFNSGGGLAAVQSGPTPPSVAALAGGASTTFTWTITVTAAGTLTYTASATGTDGVAGITTGADSGSILLAAMALLEANMAFISTTPLVDGDWFDVALTVTNVGTADANAVAPALEVNSGAALVALQSGSAAALTLVPGGVTTFVWTYSANGGGTVCLTGSATGTDAGVGGGMVRATDSNCQALLDRAKLEVAISTAPSSSAYVGETFTVTMTVTNTGDFPSTNVLPGIQFSSGGALVSPVGGVLPAGPQSITAGNSLDFVWTYDVLADGTLSYTVTATGTDGVAGNTSGSDTGSILLVGKATLAGAGYVVPATVFNGEWAQLRFTVTNTGTANATGVLPSIGIKTGVGLVSLISGPLPSGPLTLVPGGATTFVWTYSGNGAPLVEFTTTAAGVNAGADGGAISVSSGGILNILNKVTFSATLFTPATTTYVGQQIIFSMTVTNRGSVPATNVLPARQINSGAGLVGVPSEEPCYTCPIVLAPDASVIYAWTYPINGAGSFSFTATATGDDGAGGSIEATDSLSVLFLAPAALTSTLSIVPLSAKGEVGIGQQLQVTMNVRNTGGVTADFVSAFAQPITLWGPGGVSVDSSPGGMLSLPPGGSTDFIWLLTANTKGVVYFSVSSAGQDSGTKAILWTNEVGTFNVVNPAMFPSAAALQPPGIMGEPEEPSGAIRQGQTLTVTLYVENVGDVDVNTITARLTPKLLMGQKSPVNLLSGPTASTKSGSVVIPLIMAPTVPINSGNGVTFRWVYDVVGSGPIEFTATISGYDSLSGSLVTTNPSVANAISFTFTIDASALLVLEAKGVPSPQKVGKEFDVQLVVTNTGDITGLGITPALAMSGEGQAQVWSGPEPPGPVDVLSGAQQVFSWRLAAQRVGALTLTMTITGTEPLPSGLPILRTITIDVELEPPFEEQIVIYPNPVKPRGALAGCVEGDCFNVVPKLSADAELVEVDVYDAAVHRVYSGKFEFIRRGGVITVTGVKKWAPGIYMVRLRAVLGDGEEERFPVAKVVVKR